MELQDIIKERFSCRKFSDRKVDRTLIDQIIEAGRNAPTATNAQPFRIFVMESDSAREAVRKSCNYTFGADTILIVGVRNEDGWVRSFDNRSFADVDGSIVATHMMLQIADLGLATTWVGYFNAPLLKQLCPAMADYDLIALFPVGYASEDAEPSPRHFVRKPAEEISEVL